MTKVDVSETFIAGLFEHTAFRQRLGEFLHGENSSVQKFQTKEIIQVEEFVQDVNSSLVNSMKLALHHETNEIYTSHLHILNQIDQIKSAITKIAPNSSLITSTPLTKKCVQGEISTASKTQPKQLDETLFEEGVEIANLRKDMDDEERLGSLSFINSFSELKGKEEELSKEMNESLSRIEQSTEQRVSKLQKEFTKRIEQIMNTIKHLILSMEKEEETSKCLKSFQISNNIPSPKEENKKECELNKNKNSSFLNKSSNRITALFRLGR